MRLFYLASVETSSYGLVLLHDRFSTGLAGIFLKTPILRNLRGSGLLPIIGLTSTLMTTWDMSTTLVFLVFLTGKFFTRCIQHII